MLRRGFFGLASIVGLAVLAGCQSGPVVGGQPRETAMPQVVSLSPSTTELTSKFDVNRNLIGRSANCNFPQATIASAEVVMEGTTPDYEKIAELKPNVVIYDKSLFSENEISKIDQLGIKTVAWDPLTFDDYRKQLFTMSSAIGGEMTTSEYIDSVYRGFSLCRGVLSEKGITNPVMMVLIGQPGSYLAPGTESFWADILRQCGASPAGPAAKAFAPINVEAIIQANPQVIFTSTGVGTKILSDPRLQSVSAVKTKRVYDVETDVLVRRGARVEMFVDSISVAIGKLQAQN